MQILLRYGQHPSIISLRDMFQDQGKVPINYPEINNKCIFCSQIHKCVQKVQIIYFEIKIRCILCSQKHKYIQKVQVFNHLDAIFKSQVYLVFELMKGGELLDKILRLARTTNRFMRKQTRQS